MYLKLRALTHTSASSIINWRVLVCRGLGELLVCDDGCHPLMYFQPATHRCFGLRYLPGCDLLSVTGSFAWTQCREPQVGISTTVFDPPLHRTTILALMAGLPGSRVPAESNTQVVTEKENPDAKRQTEPDSERMPPDKGVAPKGENEYPRGLTFILLTVGLMVVVLVLALDNYIIGMPELAFD